MIIVGKEEYKEIKRKLESIQDMLAILVETTPAKKDEAKPKRKAGRPKDSKSKVKKADK